MAVSVYTGAGGGVASFNGRTGKVVPADGDYTKAQVGLGNVDNTSDANKPISNATQAALNDKQSKVTANGILKGDGTGTITAADETEVELVDLPQDIFLANDNTTNAEIETALSAGKLPVVVLADDYYYYTGRKSENYHAFMSFPSIGRYGYATCTNNNWYYVFEYGDIRDLVETISLPAASWVGSDPYIQTCPLKLYINDVSLAKADIQPSEELYDQLVADGVGYLAIKNVDGTFTAVAKGGKPSVDLTVQVTYNNVNVY